jgi:DNA polymerase sigma
MVFQGGLSSYSLILMVLAFLKDFSEDNGKEVCLGRVIKEMC